MSSKLNPWLQRDMWCTMVCEPDPHGVGVRTMFGTKVPGQQMCSTTMVSTNTMGFIVATVDQKCLSSHGLRLHCHETHDLWRFDYAQQA